VGRADRAERRWEDERATALCRLVAFRGDIELDGQSVLRMSRRELARVIAFVPQTPVTPLELTVAEYVSSGARPTSRTSATKRAATVSPRSGRWSGSSCAPSPIGRSDRSAVASSSVPSSPVRSRRTRRSCSWTSPPRPRPRSPAAGARAHRLAPQ